MNNKIVTRNKVTVGGGLHSRMKSAELLKELEPKVNPIEMPNRLAIICDFSSSMDSPANDKGLTTNLSKSKLSLLAEGVQDFALKSDTSNTSIAVESFPSGFRIDLTSDNQEIYLRLMGVRSLGSTPMGEGLANTLEYHKPTRAMLVSDGEQTDGDAAFEKAKTYREQNIIVDCFHIGDSKRGEETLQKIAEITGGMYFKFTDVQAFSKSLHYLLPGSREEFAQLPAETRASLVDADEVR
jgi:hypothetical protein